MNQSTHYQVICADCIAPYGGFKTKREAREWRIEHELFHAGENEGMAVALTTAKGDVRRPAIAPRLSEPQKKLLKEIRESETGGLYIDRYQRFGRTASALEKRGLVKRTWSDSHSDWFEAIPQPTEQELER